MNKSNDSHINKIEEKLKQVRKRVTSQHNVVIRILICTAKMYLIIIIYIL